MTVWRYFDSETSGGPSEYQRGPPGTQEPSISDAISESWCSVHHTQTQQTHNPHLTIPVPAIPPDQRVASWLQKYHQIPALVSPVTAAYEDALDVTRCGGGTRSEASLGDFLRCSAPYRPSFLDQKRPRVVPVDSPAVGNKRRLETSVRNRDVEVGEAADAVFLSHLLTHFVAFQPMDFDVRCYSRGPTASSSATTAVNDDCVPGEPDEVAGDDAPAGESRAVSGLWSYFSDILDDLTRDITFIQ